MSRWERTLEKLLRGTSDANVSFADLRQLLQRLGFVERVRGDHHVFTRKGVVEILNLQQVRNVLIDYKLGGRSE